jgi:flagellar protein FliO/FliZ
MLGDVLSIALALVGIIVVLILTYFASKWYAGRIGPIAGGRYIKVVDRVSVGKTASVLLIELDGVQYLLGASENGVNVLKELEEPINLSEQNLMRPSGLGDLGASFRDVFGKYYRGRNAVGKDAADSGRKGDGL